MTPEDATADAMADAYHAAELSLLAHDPIYARRHYFFWLLHQRLGLAPGVTADIILTDCFERLAMAMHEAVVREMEEMRT